MTSMETQAQFELPFAIDLFESRKRLPATPTPLATATGGVYWFNLKFKVFIKEDYK